MSTNRDANIRIELTDSQREKIRQVTGKDASAIEFTVEELEERIGGLGVESLDSRIAPAQLFSTDSL